MWPPSVLSYFRRCAHIDSPVTAWERCVIRDDSEQRAREHALQPRRTRAPVSAAAKKFGVSKSTVHKDLSERLAACDRVLYGQVKAILDENKSQRHIRGGMATRRKYKGI